SEVGVDVFFAGEWGGIALDVLAAHVGRNEGLHETQGALVAGLVFLAVDEGRRYLVCFGHLGDPLLGRDRSAPKGGAEVEPDSDLDILAFIRRPGLRDTALFVELAGQP